MECPDAVELHIHFELLSHFVAHDHTSEPTVGTYMNKVITGFPIYVDRAKLLTEFDRQDQTGTSRGDPAIYRVVWVVERNLREDGYSQSRVFIVIETPFHAQLILSEAVLGRSWKIVHSQPGIFEGELDAVPKTEIDIDIGRMSDRLFVVEERHVT